MERTRRHLGIFQHLSAEPRKQCHSELLNYGTGLPPRFDGSGYWFFGYLITPFACLVYVTSNDG